MNIESQILKNPKGFWTFLNGKKKLNGIQRNMEYEGVVSCSIDSTCELFARFFESIYVDHSNLNISFVNTTASSNTSVGSLHLSTDDVLQGIQSMNSCQSAGPDHIPFDVLKKCNSSLSLPLNILFNLSLSSGTFLDEWKFSFITPIYKAGSRQKIENYRGISKLSAIPKLFESIVTKKNFILVSKNRYPFTNMDLYQVDPL